jgi:hypothetical protein
MKTAFLAAMLAAVVFLGTHDAQAQVSDLYYYWDGAQYQQYWPQQELYSYGYVNGYPEQLYDPYYQLHVLHYQLYLPQNRVYAYPVCCVGGTVVVSPGAAFVRHIPRGVSRSPRPSMLPRLPDAVTSHSAPAIRIR